MKKTKLLVELKDDGLIDAEMHGNGETLVSAIVDVMEQNEPIKELILAAGLIYNEHN